MNAKEIITLMHIVVHSIWFPNLFKDACVLRWTPTTTTGLYAVALQIEDFSSTTQSEPYSSVPLQFLLDVSTTTDSCGNKPQLGNDTNINDTVTKLEPDATFFKTLIANTGSTSVRYVFYYVQNYWSFKSNLSTLKYQSYDNVFFPTTSQ